MGDTLGVDLILRPTAPRPPQHALCAAVHMCGCGRGLCQGLLVAPGGCGGGPPGGVQPM